MTNSPRDDIRRILKTFGIQADEAMTVHLSRSLGVPEVRVRITLMDLTDYGGNPPDEPLEYALEGSIKTDF